MSLLRKKRRKLSKLPQRRRELLLSLMMVERNAQARIESIKSLTIFSSN